MRALFFGVGVVLLVLAGGTAVAQILSLITIGQYEPIAVGSVWFSLHGNSLVGFQAIVEKSLSPSMWPPIAYVIQLPAWLVLAIPGLILILAARPRSKGVGLSSR
ncbi:MAG: hypothetical protein AAFY56_05130 [Pseudomonadota bacterium]